MFTLDDEEEMRIIIKGALYGLCGNPTRPCDPMPPSWCGKIVCRSCSTVFVRRSDDPFWDDYIMSDVV